MRAIGLMSGTSMDGIDVALIETDGHHHVVFGPSFEFPYSDETRAKIARCMELSRSFTHKSHHNEMIDALANELTLLHGIVVQQFIEQNALDQSSIDIIGFHGQTLIHRPDLGFSLQIGDGQLLANMCQIPVMYDLRAHDMLHGGQGAPLIPIYHNALAASLPQQESIAFVNIGGISNVTFVGNGFPPIAFDVGTGNALLDQWVARFTHQTFDEGGRIALNGMVDQMRVQSYLSAPFFDKSPPKSLDRHDFSLDLVDGLSLEDGAATLCAITARSIALSARFASMPPQQWIICGGGRKNAAIMRELTELLDASVLTSEDVGFNGSAMEAQGWAYLAVRAFKNLPLTFPSTTGVRQPVSGGVLKMPECKKLY
jgi:anhydro-N-acetylmuramic acid kinase